MVEILAIQKSLHNHIEFKWKFKILMKIYESACWHGGNSSYLVATIWVLFFSMLTWCQISLVENLCNYMKRWLKYVLFGGDQMGFVS
jgi:hypothetical protein